ncbi:hypothetical protein DL93DRAFT_1486945 [Clavulina sp. PMI_390]|nr:hypothetical protein DL93DRAFT_1486945 [Clavulina sp. PMI_390]
MMDTSYLMARLSLPSSHPDAIHPCLLNACYLGACASSGGGLAAFKPPFVERTRHFLQQALMFADRTTDFLWASLALGVFYARERRLVECFVGAGVTTRFAVACGLNLRSDSTTEKNSSDSSEHLLPPPKDAAEADNRARLSQAIYVASQAFPLLYECSPIVPTSDAASGESSQRELAGQVRSE